MLSETFAEIISGILCWGKTGKIHLEPFLE